MINPYCRICLGMGWVCENHPDKVWDEDLGCQCGAGMPCECQRCLDKPNTSKMTVSSPQRSVVRVTAQLHSIITKSPDFSGLLSQ